MPMATRRNQNIVAALAATMRAVVAKIVAGGGPRSTSVNKLLDLVDAWVRGDEVPQNVLDPAAKAARRAAEQYSVTSPPPKLEAAYAFEAVALLGSLAAGDDDERELILTYAGYGWLDPKAGEGAKDRTVRELYARALANGKTSDMPPSRLKHRGDPRALAALAAARRSLGKAGESLDRLGVERDPKQMATRAKLVELLLRKGYARHPAVLAFDAAFGGLLLPSEDREAWREEGIYAIVGTYACLRSAAHNRPRGGASQVGLALAPIIYAPPDTVLFLDARGRAYVQDTVGDVDAIAYARDGRSALVKTIDWLLAETHKRPSRRSRASRGRYTS